jgi:NitT/TauT family transport system permease protein
MEPTVHGGLAPVGVEMTARCNRMGVVVNAGFASVETQRVDLLRSFSATQWQIFCKARFPSALPYIFAGLEMAAAFSVVGAVVGEFVGAQAGLGVLILQLDAQMDTGGSFSVLIVLSLIGVALGSALKVLRRRVLHWMPAEKLQVKSGGQG